MKIELFFTGNWQSMSLFGGLSAIEEAVRRLPLFSTDDVVSPEGEEWFPCLAAALWFLVTLAGFFVLLLLCVWFDISKGHRVRILAHATYFLAGLVPAACAVASFLFIPYGETPAELPFKVLCLFTLFYTTLYRLVLTLNALLSVPLVGFLLASLFVPDWLGTPLLHALLLLYAAGAHFYLYKFHFIDTYLYHALPELVLAVALVFLVSPAPPHR